MNSLSWLLYLADVLPSFATGIAVFFFLLGIVLIGFTVIWFMYVVEEGHKKGYTYRSTIWLSILAFALFFFAICTNFIPSRQTIYLIAASEMGERAYLSREGQQISESLRNILKELTEKKGEK